MLSYILKSSNNNTLLIALVTILIILIILTILLLIRYPNFLKNLSSKVKSLFLKLNISDEINDVIIDRAIEISGYSYDSKQDIFYSNLDAWQRDMGYCRLYDEASAPFGMIIDCEPIEFEYNGKRWLIEFWKGQYDLTTGCEVGVYNTEDSDIDIEDFFKGTFYNSANDDELLLISFTLRKNSKILFKRKDLHWWLTGFILGEFSQPWELTMDISITFKDTIMRNEFVKGLRNANYLNREIIIDGNTVSLTFDKPHTKQPYTRTEETDYIIQKKNRLLCEKYQEITKGYDSITDKLEAIREEAPDLYKLIFKIGKPSELFNIYKILKKYSGMK